MVKRIPKIAPSKGRTIVIEQSEERPDDLCPVFSFEYMVKGHSVDDLDKDDQAALAVQLYKLSQLSWKEIKRASRHGFGFEKIRRNDIKAPLPRQITPDVNFIAFRFNGLKPMVGFRRDRIFFVVWLDHNFKLYNH